MSVFLCDRCHDVVPLDHHELVVVSLHGEHPNWPPRRLHFCGLQCASEALVNARALERVTA